MQDRVCSLIKMKPPVLSNSGVLSASGITVPVDGTGGYQPSCIFQDTNSGKMYVNEGTAVSCNFIAVTNPVVSATTQKIYVDPNGSDTEGNGSSISPVATVTKAVTLVTATRKAIILAPGSYAEAATVAWPTVNGVGLVAPGGPDVTTISVPVSGQTSVISVTPGVQTSTFTGLIQGIEIDHSGSAGGQAQSGIKFNNTGINKKLLFSVKNCTGSCDAATDKWIDVATHADADNAIRIYVSGDGNQSEIEGAINFTVNNLADRLHCEQLWIKGTITTPNVAKEFRMRLFRCVLPRGAATAGGSATQVITSVNSYTWVDYNDTTTETYLALATGDLAGSHSEVIVA